MTSRFKPCCPLYGQRVFVDAIFIAEPDMVFSAGTHTDAIRMHYNDFALLAKPVVGAFATRRTRDFPAPV